MITGFQVGSDLSQHIVNAGDDLATKMNRHANERIQSLSDLGFAAGLEKIVSFMMAKKPSLRYQTSDVVEKLQPFFEGTARTSSATPRRESTGSAAALGGAVGVGGAPGGSALS